jgi:hypothetical protein
MSTVLTCGRLGGRGAGGKGLWWPRQGPGCSRYFPKSVPSRCDATCTRPNPCTVACRLAGFDRSRRLQACITSRNSPSPRLRCAGKSDKSPSSLGSRCEEEERG